MGACIRRNFTPWSIGFVLGSYFAVSFFFYSLPQHPSLIDQFLYDAIEGRFFETIAWPLAWTIADSVLITPLCLLPFSQKIPLKRYDRHHQPFEGVKFEQEFFELWRELLVQTFEHFPPPFSHLDSCFFLFKRNLQVLFRIHGCSITCQIIDRSLQLQVTAFFNHGNHC